MVVQILDDFMAVVMMSFSDRFLHYDFINSVIEIQLVKISKISMLFSQISHTPQPLIQILTLFRSIYDDSLSFKTFWIEG